MRQRPLFGVNHGRSVSIDRPIRSTEKSVRSCLTRQRLDQILIRRKVSILKNGHLAKITVDDQLTGINETFAAKDFDSLTIKGIKGQDSGYYGY